MWRRDVQMDRDSQFRHKFLFSADVFSILIFSDFLCWVRNTADSIITGAWTHGCARFAEIFKIFTWNTQTWSLGPTTSEVWTGSFNVKAWKTTEHILHKSAAH